MPIREVMQSTATIASSDSTTRMPSLRLSDDAQSGPFVEYHERRRRHRAAAMRTVKLFDPVSGRYFAGHTCDVSESGFCLELPARVPARANQTACVFIAGSGNGRGFVEHTQMVPVRYVWVHRNSGTGVARCGVEILADTASQRRAA